MTTDICIKMMSGYGYEFIDVLPDIENLSMSLETDKFVTINFFKGGEYCSCTLRCDDIFSIYITHKYLD